jgi:hypothetical protein
VSGERPPTGVSLGAVRTAPAVPSAEGARLSAAVSEGLQAAASGADLRLSSLRIRAPANATAAEIAAAVRRAVEAAGAGKSR